MANYNVTEFGFTKFSQLCFLYSIIMLSPRAFSVLGKFLRFMGHFGVLPYAWDTKTQTLQKCEINQKRSVFLLKTYFSWLLYIFLCCLYYSHERNLKRFNQCYLFIIVGILGSLCFAVIHWPHDGGLTMINTVLQYSRYISKYETLNGIKSMNKYL